MDCKSLELFTVWLDRETGRQFTLIEAGRGVVWLVSTDHRAACSLSTEDFARRFAPELPAKVHREEGAPVPAHQARPEGQDDSS